MRVVDDEGVIRLKKKDAVVDSCTAAEIRGCLDRNVERMTSYDDSGESIPGVYIIIGRKLLDFTGVMDKAQLFSLAQIECSDCEKDEKIIVISVRRDKL